MSNRSFQTTKFPGVIYRQHKTRKHGVKFDRYFAIYYRFNGRNYQEGVGWASDGWSDQKVSNLLGELKENQRRGDPPFTLKEKRESIRAKIAQAERDALMMSELFYKQYLPQAKRDKKSWSKDEQFFRLWIEPLMGEKALSEIAALDMERLKSKMSKEGKAPKTILYALATVRQVFNYARRHRLFDGTNPTNLVKKPTADNRRMRFLTEDEAKGLLAMLKEKSLQTYEVALLSLHTGARFSEIAALRKCDFNLKAGTINYMDTKNGEARTTFMTKEVRGVLSSKKSLKPDQLVFPSKGGGRMGQVSKSFDRTVKELGFNDGITDRRQKVVFHTLRHSHASWLVQRGVDLLTVSRLMGLKTIKMCERYSHLAPEGMRFAVQTLNGSLISSEENDTNGAKKNVVPLHPGPQV